jgi:hypothetical protein
VDGESEESAMERHYIAHPEDRENRGLELLIIHIVYAKDGRRVSKQEWTRSLT